MFRSIFYSSNFVVESRLFLDGSPFSNLWTNVSGLIHFSYYHKNKKNMTYIKNATADLFSALLSFLRTP